MSGWAAGLGDALTTAGKGVLSWDDEKRRRDQEALLQALRVQQLDEGSQRMGFAQQDEARKNADFKNKSAQSLLLDIPGEQMATPGQEQAVRGSIYEGQLSPNRLQNVSTIGGMTMSGGPDPVQGVNVSQRETGPQNGSMLTPLVNPQVRIAELNSRTRNEIAGDRLGATYANMDRLYAAQGENAAIRTQLANTASERARDAATFQGLNVQHGKDILALREKIADLDRQARAGNAAASQYGSLYKTAVKLLTADPSAAFDPAFGDKVEAKVKEMLANQPVASHGPTTPQAAALAAGAAPGKSRFTLIDVK